MPTGRGRWMPFSAACRRTTPIRFICAAIPPAGIWRRFGSSMRWWRRSFPSAACSNWRRCKSYVNRALQLTARQIETLSPARHPPTRSKPLTLYYGAAELPELIGQSQHYHAALRQRGLPAELVAVPGANHFTILDALFAAGGALLRQLDHYGNH